MGGFLYVKILQKEEVRDMGFFNEIAKGAKQAINEAMEEEKRKKELGYLPDVSVSAEYKGGHPLLTKEKNCTLYIHNDDLDVLCGKRVKIMYSDITGIHYETAEQINRRITATRILTLGVFALAFKKKQKDKTKYLTIDFLESGIDCTMVISGKKSNEAYTKIFERYANFKKRNAQ